MNLTTEQMPAALAALFNASKQQGMGLLQGPSPDMTEEEAAEILAEDSYVDYCKGRVVKVHFEPEHFDLRLFDRDLGEGAGDTALRRAGVIQ